MTRNHLRQQAGGNPAQGPAPDMANPTPSPSVGEDFPDDPTGSPGPAQDQPDLDAFAERLGLSDGDADEPKSAGPDRPDDHATDRTVARRVSRIARTTAAKVADGLEALSGGLRRVADRTRPDTDPAATSQAEN